MSEGLNPAVQTTDSEIEEVHTDPLEKAKAHGYVEPAEPSREDRVKTLIKEFEHVMKHNSPISLLMMAELKALLAPEVEPAVEGETDVD